MFCSQHKVNKQNSSFYIFFLEVPLVFGFIIFIFFIKIVYSAEKNIHFCHQGNLKPNKYKIKFQYFQLNGQNNKFFCDNFSKITINSNFPNFKHNIQRKSRLTLSYLFFGQSWILSNFHKNWNSVLP